MSVSVIPTSLERYYRFLRLPNSPLSSSFPSSPSLSSSFESPSSSCLSSPTHSDFSLTVSQRNLEFLEELTTSFARLIDGRRRYNLEGYLREEVLNALQNTFNNDQYRMHALDALEGQRMSLAWLNSKLVKIQNERNWSRQPSVSTSQMTASTSIQHSSEEGQRHSASEEGQVEYTTHNADIRVAEVIVANFSLFSILGLFRDKFWELYFLSWEPAEVSDTACTSQRSVNESSLRTYIPSFLAFFSLIWLLHLLFSRFS